MPALLAALAVLLATAPALGQQESSSESLWIVTFDEPPLATYRGDIDGLPAPGRSAGGTKLDARSWQSRAYLEHLDGLISRRLRTFEDRLGREVEAAHRLRTVTHGVTLRLTAEEAAQLSTLPFVSSIEADRIVPVATDASPRIVGAPDVWDGSATGGLGANAGEGVIVGIMDTGINADHPSFSDSPEDGHTYTNPLGPGIYVGVCDPEDPSYDASFPCNEKLIGGWDFVDDATACETDGPLDGEGHGSHTASIAVGNTLTDPPISGIAPHANLIAYDVCWYDAPPTYGWGDCPDDGNHESYLSVCSQVAMTAAADQAVLDGIDVLSISILGGWSPWGDSFDQAIMLAEAAGVNIVASAGNNGPSANTVTHLAPWTLTVGGSTHDRVSNTAELKDLSGGATTPPADLTGASLNQVSYGPAPIVSGGACSSPFTAGTFTNGDIVTCTFGLTVPILAQNVMAGGAGGLIVLNDPASWNSAFAFPVPLPAVQLNPTETATLTTWLSGGISHQGTIGTYTANLDPAIGDRMWSQSSRGPAQSFDLIKPDISAPASNVLASLTDKAALWAATNPEYGYLSGTSMATPLVAGAAALVKSLHPTWTPSEIKSALMTTAFTGVVKADGTTPATPFDTGSGRVDLTEATRAPLVLNEILGNYSTAVRSVGDSSALNLPSMAQNSCQGDCAWNRRVRNTTANSVIWAASTSMPAGFELDAYPPVFSLGPGSTSGITVRVRVTDAGSVNSGWYFGTVTLTPDDPQLPAQHMPVAVIGTALAATGSIEVTKTVLGDAAPADWALTLTAETAGCSSAGVTPNPATVSGSGGTTTFLNVMVTNHVGSTCLYSIAENDQQYYELDASSDTLQGISVSAGNTTQISIVNQGPETFFLDGFEAGTTGEWDATLGER